MTQSILGLIVFAIIVAFQILKAKEAKKAGGKPTPHNENFPFPTLAEEEKEEKEDLDSDEDWLGRRVEGVPVTFKPVPISAPKNKLRGDYAAVSTLPSQKAVKSRSNIENDQHEVFELDLEKAVIYAEIINPKYKDYE